MSVYMCACAFAGKCTVKCFCSLWSIMILVCHPLSMRSSDPEWCWKHCIRPIPSLIPVSQPSQSCYSSRIVLSLRRRLSQLRAQCILSDIPVQLTVMNVIPSNTSTLGCGATVGLPVFFGPQSTETTAWSIKPWSRNPLVKEETSIC